MLFETKSSLRAHATIRRNGPRAPSRGPWLHLFSQIQTLTGGQGELLVHGERPWASATFTGSRHTLRLAFAGHDAILAGETLIAALPDHEFDIPGQLVADAAVTSAEHALLPSPALIVELEILLLEDL